MSRVNRKSGLNLTPTVFEALHDELLHCFAKTYSVSPETMVDYQVYGFNDHDESLPSIKKMIIDKTGKWVNGKYLYNKYREWKNGNVSIRLTREFVFIYFQTLDYKDVKDFVINGSFSESEISEQINLEKTIITVVGNEYYVGYYVGEEGNIIITRLTLFQESQKVQWALAYWEKKDAYSEYIYNGYILLQQNGMSLLFKNDENNLDRSQFVSIFCEPLTKVKPILVGAYSGYDRNRQPVIGEVVFVRVDSQEEQYQRVQQNTVDTEVAQYLSGKRWKALGKTIHSKFDLSTESKFVQVIDDFIQSYKGIFVSIEEGIFLIELDILDNLGNTTLRIAGHPQYSGIIKVLASGQLLIGQFTNNTTRVPLTISIEVLPIVNGIYKGDMLGISRFDKSFSGQLCASSRDDINSQLPKYKGSELTSSEIKKLPEEILNFLNEISNNSRLKKYQNSFTAGNQFYNLQHLAGTYLIKRKTNVDHNFDLSLMIKEDGKSTLTEGHHQYKGLTRMCEGGIISIYFETCNDIPHPSQLMIKVGRKTKRDIHNLEAKWFHLNEHYDPIMTSLIIYKTE